MPRFGWMRLAYLFLILTILVALARFGDPDAEARSLSARTPDAPKAPTVQENPEAPRLTEEVVSSLEDIRGSTGRPNVGPDITEPRLPAARIPHGSEPSARDEQKPEVEETQASATEPPVFYRPSVPDAGPDSGPVCGNVGGAPKDGRIVFPLEKRFYYSYDDTWGAPRAQGGHEGTDLMTPPGVPEYAITDGTVVPVAGSDADGWNTLGGHTVMVRADYSIGPIRQGDLFYYAHLERESALPIGARVQAGQVVGYAGDTGQGPPVTRGLFPPHLHLGWYDGTGDRQEADSGAMNPYPLLEWIKSNGGAVTGDSDARFCEAPSPTPPPPSNPGISPDLDTGSNDPKPSPAQKDARQENPKPAAKPDRQNRPEKQPRKDPTTAPAKPQHTNRPDDTKPTKPDQPKPNPVKPEPPTQPGPSHEQYAAAGATLKPHP
ncbi:peptidoglycan DD-metalloendopeptidase family protein [Rubrobacter tropicus]|uniref:Peptidoglycan DD-metalloendopeptidase family protein n=1 Tax=Rubrobacter tropicus TaxID=2653851 RepID=A0A6G8Q741_9ACTN|nr:M23 family metallopeptidase [Rubrobacter tropicus]QIN82304.1 peptidoglycan DD-metalloendopeptidase family protein [Rubrobacter tropicus]